LRFWRIQFAGDIDMSRKHWIEAVPSLVFAIGIIASTLLVVLAAGSGWLMAAGALLLAGSLVGADVLSSRLRGESLAPSPTAILSAVAFLVACGIVAIKDPRLVAMLIPVLGSGFGAILVRPRGRSSLCGRF
jgi:hypothetical protein